ncbi:MAG TPA: M23 family metallopeptidase [Xanthobacteraceae bacterium]|nr:M23 family metallopeptidase [Xanthobacteraceae bacterium]
MLRGVATVAAVSLLCAMGRVTAGEMQPPHITRVAVDWAAATEQLGPVVVARAVHASTAAPAHATALDELNAAVAARLPGVARSPVPVLLPFDVDGYLRDRSQGGPAQNVAQNVAQIGAPPSPTPPPRSIAPPRTMVLNAVLNAIDPSRDPDDARFFGFGHPAFFDAGPAGYDATFRFSLATIPELADVHFGGTADVAISASQLIYDVPVPLAEEGASVPALEADFPGIRRSLVEDYLRYTFVRYGVPYVVSIDCFDSAYGRHHMMACRDADRVIQLFLHKLRIAGGAPHARSAPSMPPALDRPAAPSPTFSYYAAGRLAPNTGYRGHGGSADDTVYANIRFPIAEAPAFANTQFFARRVAGGIHAYPWRDNFCESRSFYLSQCPGGMGHQGQDIGAADCNSASLGDDRCSEHRNDVIAVRDGAILRAPGQEAVWLFVNTESEHIRFRYLHMRPKLLDAAAVFSGRTVKAGELIGQVGNYSGHENGTSYHLHFDVQVPTRWGWIYVNPYMTLVSAYERLIGGRGTQVSDDLLASAATTLNDAAAPRTVTIASIRDAIFGPGAARVSLDAPRAHWRHRVAAAPRCGRHWRGCGLHIAGVRHVHGLRARAAVWRYRRHHG